VHSNSPYLRIKKCSAPCLVLSMLFPLLYYIYPQHLPLWRSITVLSAWAGSGLLVASILLMIREPHVAHWLGGLENMYRWHHRSGMLAYVLLLCHPLALAMSYFFQSPQLSWQYLSPMQASWPTLFGWLALMLLTFGLWSTFVVSLPYRRWRWMHLFLALGVLLGLLHIYAFQGHDLPLIVLTFLTLFALGWRWIASDLGMASTPYLVTQVTHPGNNLIEASLHPLATALNVRPGQFVLSAFGKGPHFHGCGEYHPFTVSAIEADGSLKLSIKSLGPCTQHLQQLEAGVQVRLQGPFGTFLEHAANAPQLWIAGGIGITPFIAALRTHPCAQPTTLLYLYRQGSTAAFLDELKMIDAADPQLELLTHATDSGLPDYSLLLDKVKQLSGRSISICGPQDMVDALLPHFLQRNIPAAAIHAEKYDFR
jgi:predicted ferric reductase